MDARRWLPILAGIAAVTFAAYPVLARAAAGASAARRADIVLIGDNEPGPDANWVEVPSGGGQSDTGGYSGTQTFGRVPADVNSRGAPVTIVEHGDYGCPYCREEEPILHRLRQKYGRQIRIVYRDFPLKRHRGAMEAAIAARCAGEQGAFQQYHDALFTGLYGFSPPQLESLASSLGLDYGEFSRCLQQQRYKGEVEQEKAQAERIGVGGTPEFRINGKLIGYMVTLSKFESIIDARLGTEAP